MRRRASDHQSSILPVRRPSQRRNGSSYDSKGKPMRTLPLFLRKLLRRRGRGNSTLRLTLMTVVVFLLVGAILHLTGGSTARSEGMAPRVVHVLDPHADNQSVVKHLSDFYKKYPVKHRLIDDPMSPPDVQDDIEDSEEYYSRADKFETSVCKAQYDWQLQVKPSCNTIHEQDISHPIASDGRKAAKLVANGYWRDVWVMDDNMSKTALKTLRYEHDVEERNFDRHRRDSMAMEHLTKSPWILDIYAHCGNSGLFEFAPDGDLSDYLYDWDEGEFKEGLSSAEKLEIATQVALGLKDVHNIDKLGVPSMVHADISWGQWVYVNGRFKLNDFNRARFLPWNTTSNIEPCAFYVGKNPGKNRSPEEYAYRAETAKIDVFSMGNIFYMLLMEQRVWHHVNVTYAQESLVAGGLPEIWDDVENSTDPHTRVLMQAMSMCHEYEPTQRAGSLEVAQLLQEHLEKMSPGHIDKLLKRTAVHL